MFGTLRFLFGRLVLSATFILSCAAWAQGNKVITPDMTSSKDSRPDVIGTITSPRAHFVFPQDGATVGQKFTAKFKVEGFKVAKAGAMEPATGHFHIIVNKPAVKEGEVIPVDANHIHYGNGEMEAVIKLPPGKHTLTLQFADGAHRAYGGGLVQTIKVTVK